MYSSRSTRSFGSAGRGLPASVDPRSPKTLTCS
ncbi:UNVERIFIED_CONTAM: hypothetical protein GTU68_020324 [Idotea baltica]|nr:hypothetical protein [Idotea baltica]